MKRSKATDASGAVWHVTGRVNWQIWHLKSERAYETLLAHLREALNRFAMNLLSFVVMSNHYHMVVQSPESDRFKLLTGRRTSCRHFRPWPKGHLKCSVVGQWAHRLKLGVAKELQEQLELSGHFWDGPHHRRRIIDLWALVVAMAYDHRNPVRAGIVAVPHRYPRSSADWWLRGSPTPLPLLARSALPFGLTSIEELRTLLLGLQRQKLLDDVMEAFKKRGLRFDSRAGRLYLEKLMTEAGLAPLQCGTDAASPRPQPSFR